MYLIGHWSKKKAALPGEAEPFRDLGLRRFFSLMVHGVLGNGRLVSTTDVPVLPCPPLSDTTWME